MSEVTTLSALIWMKANRPERIRADQVIHQLSAIGTRGLLVAFCVSSVCHADDHERILSKIN